MNDLVKRLNAWADNWKTLIPPEVRTYLKEAASRITELEAENKRLREALKPFASIKPSSFHPEDGSEAEAYSVVLKIPRYGRADFTGADLRRARKGIGE